MEDDLLGTGSESWVYRLGGDRILRIRRGETPNRAVLERSKSLLAAMAGRLPFATPVIEAIGQDGTTIEKRLHGRTMTDRLPGLTGAERRRAFENYFAAAAAMSAVTFPDSPYGMLLAGDPIQSADWPAFLRASLDRYVARNRIHIEDGFGDAANLIDKANALLPAVPDHPAKALVHGDFFPGNVLMDDDLAVTAVVDFGAFTLVGDPLFDMAGAIMFPEASGDYCPSDIAGLRELMATRFGEPAIAVMPYYRAYFALSLAEPDTSGLYPRLYPWAIETLRALDAGTLRF